MLARFATGSSASDYDVRCESVNYMASSTRQGCTVAAAMLNAAVSAYYRGEFINCRRTTPTTSPSTTVTTTPTPTITSSPTTSPTTTLTTTGTTTAFSSRFECVATQTASVTYISVSDGTQPAGQVRTLGTILEQCYGAAGGAINAELIDGARHGLASSPDQQADATERLVKFLSDFTNKDHQGHIGMYLGFFIVKSECDAVVGRLNSAVDTYLRGTFHKCARTSTPTSTVTTTPTTTTPTGTGTTSPTASHTTSPTTSATSSRTRSLTSTPTTSMTTTETTETRTTTTTATTTTTTTTVTYETRPCKCVHATCTPIFGPHAGATTFYTGNGSLTNGVGVNGSGWVHGEKHGCPERWCFVEDSCETTLRGLGNTCNGKKYAFTTGCKPGNSKDQLAVKAIPLIQITTTAAPATTETLATSLNSTVSGTSIGQSTAAGSSNDQTSTPNDPSEPFFLQGIVTISEGKHYDRLKNEGARRQARSNHTTTPNTTSARVRLRDIIANGVGIPGDHVQITNVMQINDNVRVDVRIGPFDDAQTALTARATLNTKSQTTNFGKQLTQEFGPFSIYFTAPSKGATTLATTGLSVQMTNAPSNAPTTTLATGAISTQDNDDDTLYQAILIIIIALISCCIVILGVGIMLKLRQRDAALKVAAAKSLNMGDPLVNGMPLGEFSTSNHSFINGDANPNNNVVADLDSLASPAAAVLYQQHAHTNSAAHIGSSSPMGTAEMSFVSHLDLGPSFEHALYMSCICELCVLQ